MTSTQQLPLSTLKEQELLQTYTKTKPPPFLFSQRILKSENVFAAPAAAAAAATAASSGLSGQHRRKAATFTPFKWVIRDSFHRSCRSHRYIGNCLLS